MKVRIPNQNGGMNQQQMLRKVQQMQEDMANLQADLDEREYSAEAGGGLVSVTVTVLRHRILGFLNYRRIP